MLRYTTGNIFASGAMALVNTVNTEGIMGKGLALQFKKRYPENYVAYAYACKQGEVAIGKMFIVPYNNFNGLNYIINFPTKNKWRTKSKLSDITKGLLALKNEIIRLKITSIAIPPLGCGLGGLKWKEVRHEIESVFSDFTQADIIIYEPLKCANPAPQPVANPHLTKAKALFLRCYQLYMDLAPASEITFVEAHKLAYLLQNICHIDLHLRFKAWKYGPYALNLAHVLNDMEGTWIDGFGDGTHKAFETFHLLPAAADALVLSLPKAYEEALRCVDAVFEGFESPLGLELLATVHWLVNNDGVPASREAIVRALASWKNNYNGWGERKVRLFPPSMIDMALTRLASIEPQSL